MADEHEQDGLSEDYLSRMLLWASSGFDWRSLESHLNDLRALAKSVGGLIGEIWRLRTARDEAMALLTQLVDGWQKRDREPGFYDALEQARTLVDEWRPR